ncbi:hypothetical protein F2Q69_00036399 [Brassica cretica]|uniref:Uncharacterized protein n=1 Tax=Brassica cretica TaxID=69181 RepID=A0A8S9SR64_BRACR|nr:hypothetical protein F2Q69_00036399 [Brassica cretica]
MVSQIVWLGMKDVFTQIAKDVIGQGLDHGTFVFNIKVMLRYVLEKYGDFGVLECHRFEVNHHPLSDVMPVLLKSGQYASQEEAVEKMKDCRSMTQHWCRLTVMLEYGMSIFYDR